MHRNQSVSAHSFAMVPRADIPRSRFSCNRLLFLLSKRYTGFLQYDIYEVETCIIWIGRYLPQGIVTGKQIGRAHV